MSRPVRVLAFTALWYVAGAAGSFRVTDYVAYCALVVALTGVARLFQLSRQESR
ncbi:MAG TPA: hypothetical protein VD862_03155 [Candidatus Paceibacterota bacterium]|nr:hypothetical protein [Candidatus Paceibacterota bacterium]